MGEHRDQKRRSAENVPSGGQERGRANLRVLRHVQSAVQGERRADTQVVASEITLLRRQGRAIWEQLSCESDSTYALFKTYLSLGPTRSQQKLAGALGQKRVMGNVPLASTNYFWVERAAAYDAAQVGETPRGEEGNRYSDQEIARWAERQSGLAEGEYDTGSTMFAAVQDRMNRARGFRIGQNGERMHCPAEPLEIEDKDLPKFAKAAVGLMAQGIERFRSEYSVEKGAYHGIPALPADLGEVSDDELLRYAEVLVRQQAEEQRQKGQGA